ncbi:MAG: class I SAM-dependent rRNA methyltransferase [Myxococcota bacterium]
MSRRLVVNGYSARWLRQGFAWVYPKEVASGKARPGQTVVLADERGAVLGTGVADDGFVAVRRFRDDEGPLDRGWLFGVLDRAWAHREQVVDEATTGFRIVHGQNDGLPGIRLDVWAEWATIVLDSESLTRFVDDIVTWLVERRASVGVVCCYRADPRDARRLPEPHVVFGEVPDSDVLVTERGLAYRVRPTEGPDVGLYADMREVRGWLESHWTGMRVLNLFAYTAAFSVSAAVFGAARTTSIDLSGPILARARDNFVINGLDPEDHDFEAEDAFKALDRHRRKGNLFDRVIVDPPSFSRGKEGFSAKRDWPRLTAAATRVLEDGGWLIAASNQGQTSPRAFETALFEGFKKARAHGQLIHVATQGPDFPAATWFPEGRYLKVRIYRVWR